MNPLKKGPEIRVPELGVPDFMLDIYYDLRARHLLPLVAVLAVAIVAVPIALTQSSGSGSTHAVAVANPATLSPKSSGQLIVADSAPGLRAYRHRLDNLHSKNPFRSQHPATQTSTESGGASGGEGTGGSSSASSSGSSGSSGTRTGTITLTHTLTLYTWSIDVRVVPKSSGGKATKAEARATSSELDAATGPKANPSSKATPTVRRNLKVLTLLPSRKIPAAIFMGVTKDGKKALLEISSNVTGIFGEGVCLLGSKTCQLLELEPGSPETFVYGPRELTFNIELLKIHLVAHTRSVHGPAGKPNFGH